MHQSEARPAATVWNCSGKTLSPGALLAVLYFSSCHIFFRPFRLFLVPTICPWVSEDACPMERYIPVAQTRPKPPRAWLLFLQAGYKRAVLGTTILSNGKEHFGPTDQNDQTGQRGPPSKLIPNIPVGLNRNGPFDVATEFWVEWKAPSDCIAHKSHVTFLTNQKKVRTSCDFSHALLRC